MFPFSLLKLWILGQRNIIIILNNDKQQEQQELVEIHLFA